MYLSYALLREMYPLLNLDARERNTVLVCYATVPIQYGLAYFGMETLFLAFIPCIHVCLHPFSSCGAWRN